MSARFPDPSGDIADERTFAELRDQMVEKSILGRGIRDPAVLKAMREVPRHQFVSARLQNEAYQDWPLSIGYGQTISQPYTVAFMAQAAELRSQDRVLEIGAGCGYGAAVLSRIVREVHTTERIPELAAMARDNLAQLGYVNAYVHPVDGSLGLPSIAPFDAIVVTSGADQLPPPLVEQLAEGGRIVIPIGQQADRQNLLRYTRIGDQLVEKNLGVFAFVPLLGKFGRKNSL
jgi:protein-L-isoaspartate(D-aspartate) O-methyltransferase